MFKSETLGTTVLAMCTISFHRSRNPNDQILKMAAFYAYAISSFSAFYFHINDEIWQKGETLKSFTSSYLCRFHELFLFFENSYPKFFIFSQLEFAFTVYFNLLPFAFLNKHFQFIFFGDGFSLFLVLFFRIIIPSALEIILWLSLFIQMIKSKNTQQRFIKFGIVYFFVAYRMVITTHLPNNSYINFISNRY